MQLLLITAVKYSTCCFVWVKQIDKGNASCNHQDLVSLTDKEC